MSKTVGAKESKQFFADMFKVETHDNALGKLKLKDPADSTGDAQKLRRFLLGAGYDAKTIHGYVDPRDIERAADRYDWPANYAGALLKAAQQLDDPDEK